MSRVISDRKLLLQVYKRYYQDFVGFDEKEAVRSTKIYVPIDCNDIARRLGVDPDIIFGRLYYHLEKKYGYKQSDGSNVHLFAMKIGSDMHAVHFPMLSAVVAELEEAHTRFTLPLVISAIALIVSLASLLGFGT